MQGLQELRSLLGADQVRESAAEDSVDGVRPGLVVRPGTVEEVSGVMAMARRTGWRVSPRGRGTKLGWGNPPEGVDLLLDLSRLDRVLEHSAGDLVISVEAGIGLHTLQEHVAGAGQMLALDPPEAGASIGGVIAANASGPRRYRYGTARDLLIGATLVLGDGTIARSGSKVVKNVAGYDLAKLVTGSLGTLGVIVKAIFRLHPRPAAARLVEAEMGSAAEVEAAVQRLIHSTLVPTAIQLAWPAGAGPRVGVLFEGIEPSVVAQAATAAALLGEGAATRGAGEVEASWRELIDPGAREGGVMLKIACLRTDLARVIDAARGAAARHGVECSLTGMLGNGILQASLGGGAGELVSVAREIRAAVPAGSAVVVAAPAEVKREVDVWGPVGDALGLMKRVKAQFDPDRILNPGRFVGGI
jgi:glycolate oxidase FAD binding subunit